MRQILKQNFYKASDLELKNFTTCQNFMKKIFPKSTILKKKVAHKKSRFGSIYPVKCAKLCRLRAILKSTFLKKIFIQKSTILDVIFFSKRHDFEWKSFCKKHSFEMKILLRVRF